MSTFYLDIEAGNDASDGTSFANRWKTFTLGATAARIAPGDTIRVMAATDATDMSQNATWTKGSQTLTLTTAVTQTIDMCETAWTASANVTTSTTSNSPEGTNSAGNQFAGAFTTGLASFKATGTLDLSGYQQLSFWLYTTAAFAASTLSLRLCSDVAGVTTVDTLAIPAITPTSQWIAITVDKGSALGSSIKSIALYADLDPATPTVYFDNIIACKASSAADALSLKSLVGKVQTLAWVASTTYAANVIRRPTEANRTGFAYKVTAGGGGAAGGSEPTWPQEIGLTVTDGALTWTCQQLEELWQAICSISGTTVKLGRNLGGSNPKSNMNGYAGSTEAVAIYKREFIDMDIVGTAAAQTCTKAGTEAGGDITYSGGWDRTNMSTRSGQTWLGRGGNTTAIANNILTASLGWNTIDGINCVNGSMNAMMRATLKNCHVVSSRYGFTGATNSAGTKFQNCAAVACWTGGFLDSVLGGVIGEANCISSNSHAYGVPGIAVLGFHTNSIINSVRYTNVDAKQCDYGIQTSGGGGPEVYFYRLTTEGTRLTNSGMNVTDDRSIRCYKCTIDSIGIGSGFFPPTCALFSQDDGAVAGTHLITQVQGTIRSATDQRNTASGIAWKFQPSTTTYQSQYLPLELSIAKVAVGANTLVTVTLYVRRDATNIKGRLRLKPGQINGISLGSSTDCNPSANTWTQYTLTFTPTEAGVVELHFQCWNTINATEHLWIDDIAISQA